MEKLFEIDEEDIEMIGDSFVGYHIGVLRQKNCKNKIIEENIGYKSPIH